MDVTVSIVTYNSSSTIRDCLDSVLAQEGVKAEIVVVDNLSADATVEVLRKFGDRVRVVAHSANSGFGAGHNLAARHAGPSRYQLVLNPDASLLQRDALRRLVDWMDAHPACGLAGMVLLENGGRAPPKMDYPGARGAPLDFSGLPGTIAWVLGASMMVRRDAFEKVGGFDEGFFMYGEETDLCLRLRKAGYEIGYVEGVTVSHIGGVSEGRTPAYDLQMQRQKRLHRLYRKHYPPEAALFIVRRDLRRSRWRLALHSLRGRIFGMNETVREDCGRYRAICESCRSFLDVNDAGRG
jgi:hypothetical protein